MKKAKLKEDFGAKLRMERPRPPIDDRIEIDEQNDQPIPGPVEGYR